MQTTEVENWLGETSIMGPELMKKARAHVEHFGVPFLADAVESVDLSKWPFKITTEDGKTINALSLIITTGASPSKLDVPGENKYWGSGGVSSCAVCDAPFYKGKNVVVVGGGDSAVEEAIQLAKHVNHVTLLVRKGKMRSAASMQDRLKGYKNIEVIYNMQIQEILGNDTQLTHIKLLNNETDEVSDMPIDGVFLAVGHNPNSWLFKGQLALDDHGNIKMRGRTQETSVKGVFAAGDIEDNRYRQAFISSGRGNAAALDAEKFLTEIGFNDAIVRQLQEKTKRAIEQADDQSSRVQLVKDLKTLHDTIRRDKVVIVDFFAEYCPSCMQMLPVYDSVSKEFKDVTFIKVDTDEAPAIADEYKVFKIPTMLVFKDGKLVDRHVSAMSRVELRNFIDKFVKS
jgi:thioredoxin reductase (NADPH)